MLKLSRSALLAAFVASLAPLARAEEFDAPPVDASRPAVGEWTGLVSWSEGFVLYGWRIDHDGTFSSGRAGRGHDGGGAWTVNGAHLTLKYENGFRYEGELRGNAYAGEAYRANGRMLGTFSMSRVKFSNYADE